MVQAKEVKKELLYQNAALYALVDPVGTAVQLGNEKRCLAEFFKRRLGPIILSDEDYDRAREMLKDSGWQVIPVRMGVFTSDVGDLNKLLKTG